MRNAVGVVRLTGSYFSLRHEVLKFIAIRMKLFVMKLASQKFDNDFLLFFRRSRRIVPPNDVRDKLPL